jgi:nicotinamide-nucleotide amidase
MNLTKILSQKGLKISVAESCTGGALSHYLTQESGASEFFESGFITYSNSAKVKMLGVDEQVLGEFGAVSEQTAYAMVKGLIKHTQTEVGVSITGVAGPTGGSQKKPVGTVCFGFFINEKYHTCVQYFSGNRASVVEKSVAFVIKTILKKLI